MDLILIRHGVAEAQAGCAIGHTDLALSEAGAESIRALALTATAAPARIFSSDLQRARASAELLAERWSMVPEIDERLREMHFGAWDGRAWADIYATEEPTASAWMAEWTTSQTPAGESFADVRTRARSWYDAWHATAQDGPTWVMTHAGFIRALLVELLPWPAERAFDLGVDHGCVTVLRHQPHGMQLQGLNGRSL